MLFTNKYRNKQKNKTNNTHDDSSDIRTLLNDAKVDMNNIHRIMETSNNMYQLNHYTNLIQQHSQNVIGKERFRLIKSNPLPISKGQYTYSNEILEREYMRKSNIHKSQSILRASSVVGNREDSKMNMNSYMRKDNPLTEFELFEEKPYIIKEERGDDSSDDSSHDSGDDSGDDSDSSKKSDMISSDVDDDNVLNTDSNNNTSRMQSIHRQSPPIESKPSYTENVVKPEQFKTIDNLFDYKKYIADGLKIEYEGYIPEEELEPEIPLICYTTWHTQELPPEMRSNYEHLCKRNPELEFKLYDESQCRHFIENNFDKDVLDAYNKLSPSSYKSDLWRYCVLYKNGGIYIDIKYHIENCFKLYDLCEREHFVLDRSGYWEPNNMGIYTALISVKPRNKIIRACIQSITNYTENYYYGHNALYPTGPGLLGQQYFRGDFVQNIHLLKDIKIFHNENANNIIYKNTVVLSVYDGYREEQLKYQNNLHYSKLWEQRAIYNMNINMLIEKKVEKTSTYLPRVCCICHIGSYHIFNKMKTYIDNLVSAQYDAYHLDIYFNVIDTISKDEIRQLKKSYPNETIFESENYGFDIGSFFHILEHIKRKSYTYDYLLKIHTKTNNNSRTDLLTPIMGSIQSIRDILTSFENKKEVGIIASKKRRCIDAHVDFTRNQPYLQQLLKWRFNETTTICKQPYVSGTMFWVRFSLMDELFMKYNLPNIYNSLNNIHTFDWNWYYHANHKEIGNIPLHKEKLYDHYNKTGRQQRLSGNIFHAIKYDTNSMYLRDGMVEHTYERFFCYGVHRLGYRIYFIQ